jgi:hypothetical protein
MKKHRIRKKNKEDAKNKFVELQGTYTSKCELLQSWTLGMQLLTHQYNQQHFNITIITYSVDYKSLQEMETTKQQIMPVR